MDQAALSNKGFWQTVFMSVINQGKPAESAKETADLAVKSQPIK
jgi:hypothetical protein